MCRQVNHFEKVATNMRKMGGWWMALNILFMISILTGKFKCLDFNHVQQLFHGINIFSDSV